MRSVGTGLRKAWSAMGAQGRRRVVALILLAVVGCLSLAVEERRTRLVWAELSSPAAGMKAGASGQVWPSKLPEKPPGKPPDKAPEKPPEKAAEEPPEDAAPPRTAPPQPNPVRAERSGATVDLNRATARELEALPGIGPALARRILAYRETQGPFRSVAELQRVSGIGPRRLSRLTGQVCVGP